MAVTLTLRQYLTIRAMERRAIEGLPIDWTLAREAVATTALEHPEWDMNELDTWEGWVMRHG